MFYTFALIVGGLLLLQSIFLSETAKRVGLIKSNLIHFISAMIFIGILMSFGIFHFQIKNIERIPFYAYLGPVISVVSLALMSNILPKMSVLKSTILVFSGQIAMNLIIDLIIKTQISVYNLLGIAFIGAGFILNVISSNKVK